MNCSCGKSSICLYCNKTTELASRVASQYLFDKLVSRVAARFIKAEQMDFTERLGLAILDELEKSSGYPMYHGFDAKGGAVVTDVKPNGFTMHCKPQIWDEFKKKDGVTGMLRGGIFLSLNFDQPYKSLSPADSGDRLHSWSDADADNRSIQVSIHGAYWNKRLKVDSANGADLGTTKVLLDAHEDFIIELDPSAGSNLKELIEHTMSEPPTGEFVPKDKGSARQRLKKDFQTTTPAQSPSV